MKRLEFSRNFLLVWIGQMVSSIGVGLSTFTLGLWVLRTTGSTTQFALTFIAMAIPSIFVSPIAGPLVDRLDRRKIMIVCDVLAALLMLAITALLIGGHLAVWHVYLVTGVTSLLNSFRSPAYSSSIPLITPTEQLPRANALVQTSEAVSAILGPLLAGVLVTTIGFQGVVAINACTFIVGAVTLLMVTIPRVAATTQEDSHLLREAIEGWHYVRQRPGLSGLLSVYGFNHFVFAMASVLIAPLLLSFTSAAFLGMQYSISGTGLLLGGLAMTALGGTKKRINGVLMYSMVGGVLLAAHGVRPSFALAACAGFVLFLLLPMIDASNASIWQTKVPAHLQGRCFAIQQLLLSTATAVGFGLAGPLADHVFEPLLSKQGALAHSVGQVIGVGPGRGIGLIFILLGVSMSLVALRAYSRPAIRHIDDLEDAVFVEAAPAAQAALHGTS